MVVYKRDKLKNGNELLWIEVSRKSNKETSNVKRMFIIEAVKNADLRTFRINSKDVIEIIESKIFSKSNSSNPEFRDTIRYQNSNEGISMKEFEKVYEKELSKRK